MTCRRVRCGRLRKRLSDKEAMYFNGRETRKVTWNDSERSEVIPHERL